MADNDKMTDMEFVLRLIGHIDNPCGPGLQEVYLNEAERALPTITNPVARSLLEDKLREHGRSV